MSETDPQDRGNVPSIPPAPQGDDVFHVPPQPAPLSPADIAYTQAGQIPPPPPATQQTSGVSAQTNPPQQGFSQGAYGQLSQPAYTVPASAPKKKSKLWILWIIIPILIATCLLFFVIFPLRAFLSPESPAYPMNPGADYTTEYTDGDYTVGSDIDPGLYYLSSTSTYDAYFEIRESGKEDIYTNDNVTDFTLIELERGYDITISRASMHRIDPDEPIEVNDKIVTDGFYRVGLDIPAGDYYVKADDGAPVSAVNRYSDMSHTFSSLEDVVSLDPGTTGYFTAQEGSYIQVKHAVLEKIIGDSPSPARPLATTFGAGMFKVGTDIAPGDYYLYADDPGTTISLVLSSDASGTRDAQTGASSSVARTFVHVENGQYLLIQVRGGDTTTVHGVPFSEATPAAPPYYNSDYLVGFDMAPGSYTLTPDDDPVMAESWVTIYDDTTFSHIVDIYPLKSGETQTVELSAGQVLSLSEMTATPA